MFIIVNESGMEYMPYVSQDINKLAEQAKEFFLDTEEAENFTFTFTSAGKYRFAALRVYEDVNGEQMHVDTFTFQPVEYLG